MKEFEPPLIHSLLHGANAVRGNQEFDRDGTVSQRHYHNLQSGMVY